MDPEACFALFVEAVHHERVRAAQEAYENLRTWLLRGGFEPTWGKHPMYKPRRGVKRPPTMWTREAFNAWGPASSVLTLAEARFMLGLQMTEIPSVRECEAVWRVLEHTLERCGLKLKVVVTRAGDRLDEMQRRVDRGAYQKRTVHAVRGWAEPRWLAERYAAQQDPHMPTREYVLRALSCLVQGSLKKQGKEGQTLVDAEVTAIEKEQARGEKG